MDLTRFRGQGLCSLLLLKPTLLMFDWREIRQGGMTALTIIEPLDIIKHTAARVRVRVKYRYAYLSFERGKKAFHHGIIPTVTFAAHTWPDLNTC